MDLIQPGECEDRHCGGQTQVLCTRVRAAYIRRRRRCLRCGARFSTWELRLFGPLLDLAEALGFNRDPTSRR